MSVAAAAGLLSPALVRAGEPPALVELRALERQAVDPALSPAERDRAADRALDLRARLIQATTDPAVSRTLRIDQAAAWLARASRDGSDSAVLLGLASETQRRAVQGPAQEAFEALAWAGRLAEARSPIDPDAAHDRTVRVPFYRARAGVLLAACAGERDLAVAHARAARDAIATLALADHAPECARRVTLGIAMLLGGEESDLPRALEEFAAVVHATPGPPPRVVVEAWMGLVRTAGRLGTVEAAAERLQAAMTRPPFVFNGTPDALHVILVTEALTVAFSEQSRRTGQATLLELAAAQWQALAARSDLGVPPAALRALACEKLADLAHHAGPEIPLPPAIRFARALRAAREPALRGGALDQLLALVDSPLGADAMWEAAVLLMAPGGASPADRLRAVALLTRLAREMPEHPRAPEAVTAAVAHAHALCQSPEAPAEARQAYAQVLALACEAYAHLPDVPLWRYERARLLLDEAHQPSLDALARAARLGQAAAELARMPADSPLAPPARRACEQAHLQRLEALWEHFMVLRTRDGRAAAELARETIVPAATEALRWAARHDPAVEPRFRADLAQAQLESGDARAGELFSELLLRREEVRGGVARLRLGQARAALLTGERASALAILRALTAEMDTPPSPDPRLPITTPADPRDIFWHTWTLLLETLADEAENVPGSHDPRSAVRAHLRRLELLDANLGGEPWRSRLRRLQAHLER